MYLLIWFDFVLLVPPGYFQVSGAALRHQGARGKGCEELSSIENILNVAELKLLFYLINVSSHLSSDVLLTLIMPGFDRADILFVYLF